jgi:hypothetical protein
MNGPGSVPRSASFTLLYAVQIGCDDHGVSYPARIGDKAAGA